MPLDDLEARIEAAVDPIYQIPENEPYDGKLGSGRIFLPLALEGLPPAAAVRAALPRGLEVSLYPNPSIGSVALRVSDGAPRSAAMEIVEVTVTDLSGRAVRALAGRGDLLTWDGRDEAGRILPTGVYWVRIATVGGTTSLPVRMIR
jgi:hypothetical protein